MAIYFKRFKDVSNQSIGLGFWATVYTRTAYTCRVDFS